MKDLRTQLTGRLVTPEDPDWDQARQAWNLCVDQRPAAVVQAESPDDIVAAVRFAAEHGLAVSAQPRGHGATAGTVDGTILLRTSALRTIQVDVAGGTATVGAGVRWGELNKALTGTGLSGLPGSSGDTTVVGYTLGGGLSWFGRRYGLAANHVRRFELVTADGTLIHVTRQSDPELFWALRGGGGEFGIVTAMELELVLAPQIHGGRMIWPVENARDVFRTFARITETAPEELTLWAWLLNLPDLPMVPEPLRGRWVAAVDGTFLGSGTEADALLAPLRAVGPTILDTFGTVTLAELDAIADEPTDPAPGMVDSMMLTRFDDAAIDDLLAVAAPGTPSPMMAYEIRNLGGALARRTEFDGACGHVPEPFMLLYAGMVAVPELAAPIKAGQDAVRAAMTPHASSRQQPNFTETSRPEDTYPPETLARLRRIKQQRDPANTIRGNRPIG